jgi:serine/threonine protein kinase
MLSLRRYVVLRPLGNGGMSSVYLARDQAIGRLCVLKTLASVDQHSVAWRLEAAACLGREAELLGQLDHPRVAHLLGWSSDGGNDFLVLEYIAGPTLEQRLSRATAGGNVGRGAAMPIGQALGYGCAVAETLCYLAELPQPVAHCDIKPANLILRAGSGTPVLVDFGGAVHTLPGLRPTIRLDRYGTPGYAAPEQYAGCSSPQSDVDGLAATLYQLTTGDDPSAHPLAFPALAALPTEVASVLAAALAPAPDARRFGAALRDLAAAYVLPALAAPVAV